MGDGHLLRLALDYRLQLVEDLDVLFLYLREPNVNQTRFNLLGVIERLLAL